MSGPNELDRTMADDLRALAEGLRNKQALLGDDALHADVDKDLSTAARILEQAADKLLSVE
jgi:hypothetical protein